MSMLSADVTDGVAPRGVRVVVGDAPSPEGIDAWFVEQVEAWLPGFTAWRQSLQ